ncbi:flagellar hook-associated protein FlgL [Clostridium brassicae]|uniref:Flagellar hook-associated protein FlgL n=1 Tax=Clostridium brassicae TaxID=2999072 RepID=A0ABT4DB58_9CLOT|nr:flagellar hook-associated protein FlgL [Clostridium brassicae]MCY6959546.1 flagellar hook-associated protein FlgL [Clostridium brassicae]
MRITNKMLSNTFLSDMRNNLENIKKLQEQMTSGKEIRRPSDDPLRVARAMNLHTDIAENKQYNQNISDTINWLDTTDTALGQVGDVLHRVRELLISAGNAGYSSSERRAIKDEINEKVGEISQILNTNFDGKYVFGGTRGTTKPVDVVGGINYKDALKVKINIDDLNSSLKSNDVKIELKNSGTVVQTITLPKDTSGKKFKNVTELANEINKQINTSGQPFENKLKAVPVISEGSITFVYDKSKLSTGDPEKIDISSGISELNGKEIKKAEVIDSGNTNIFYNKREGGTLKTTDDPNTDDGKQYNMINKKLTVQISQGVKMDYNVCATEVLEFTNEKGESLDLREVLRGITNHLDGKDSDGTALDENAIKDLVNGDLQKLTDAMNNVLKIRSEVGAKQNRMDSAHEKNTDANFNMTEILSKTEDIDITEKTMEFAVMQTVYLASLQTSARVIQPSLLDYLR